MESRTAFVADIRVWVAWLNAMYRSLISSVKYLTMRDVASNRSF